MAFEESYLYHRWHNRVMQGPSNDFVIGITASGKSSMSRTGKTTLETFIADEFDQSDGGFDAEEKATLDAGTLAYEVVPEVENRSVVCLEEAQGSPGTDGLDARRSMKSETIDAINSILNNGDKMLTVIITAQHLPMLDKRIPPILDAWLLIRYGPSSPHGPLGIHHGMYVEDYNFGNPQIKTPAYEQFTWPRIPKDDPNYRVLEEKKQKAKQRHSADGEEDQQLSKDVQAEIAQQFRDLGHSPRWIENNVDAITYRYNWIYEHTEAPDEDDDTSQEATA